MSKIKNQIKIFIKNFTSSLADIDIVKLEKLALEIINLRKTQGKLFLLGVGGSAGNCSHAVNDFRKLCKINAFCPTDNISEITARINDEGWENSYKDWLEDSGLSKKDALFVFSVGGGDIKKKVSVNLIRAIKLAKEKKSKVFSIVGRKNSYTFKNSNISLVVKSAPNLITPTSETMQVLVWHSLVSLQQLMIKKNQMVKKKNKNFIFLDRDGVINKSRIVNGKPFAPTKFSDFKIFKYTKNCLKRLNEKFIILIITNQPDIGNKILKKKEFNKMCSLLKKKYPIQEVYFCPHKKEDGCDCRKPKIGLLKKAYSKYVFNKKKTFMIGDRNSDMIAAEQFGIKPIFIDRNYKEQKPLISIPRFKNLVKAVSYVTK